MLYFFDSNVCIDYMRKGKKAGKIEAKIFEVGPRNIKLPSVVMAELMHGAYKSKRPAETLKDTRDFLANFEIIPFDFIEAIAYGQIRADLERKGQLIGNNDMLIAATAITYNAALVTNNTEEFSRIDGLKLEDWTI